MVAPVAPPPAKLPGAPGTAPSPRGTPNMRKKAAAPVGKPPVYDVADVQSDWTTLMNTRRQFDLDVILKSDQFYRQRDPDTPYLNIPDRDGTTNLAKQVTDPTYTFLVDKGTAYNLSGDIAVRCPSQRNAAGPRNLGLCEDTIRFTFDHNEAMAPAHFNHSAIHKYFFLNGWCPLELSWPAEDAAKEMLGGYPIKLTAHNPLTVAYEYDPDGTLRRVIVAKRMLAGELPDGWKTGSLAGKADTDEVTVFQDYNKFVFSAVVEGEVVDTYTHEYVDLLGNPMVPWVIGLHDPINTRLGDIAPQLSYSTPRELLVGRPPLMGLLKMLELRSFYMTSERYNIREFLTAWVKLIGDVDADWDGKQFTVSAVGAGDALFIEPPNALANIEAGLQLTDQMIQAGGMSQDGLSGNRDKAQSGVAVQAATDVVKQMFESVRRTHEKLYAAAGKMILAMVKSHTTPSGARLYKKATGRDLAAFGGPDIHPEYQNTNALPYYWWVTGDVRVPVDALTVAGVTAVECGIQPYDDLPKQQRIQLSMNIWQMEAQTGKKVLPDEMVYGEIWGASNPQAVLDRIATDELLSDPNRPFRKIRALRTAAIERMGADSADPDFWNTSLTQLEQVEEQAWQSVWKQEIASLAQGGGGQPQPGQAPPGQPPPGGPPGPAAPPQAPPPMQPGAPAGGGPPGANGPVPPFPQSPPTGPEAVPTGIAGPPNGNSLLGAA